MEGRRPNDRTTASNSFDSKSVQGTLQRASANSISRSNFGWTYSHRMEHCRGSKQPSVILIHKHFPQSLGNSYLRNRFLAKHEVTTSSYCNSNTLGVLYTESDTIPEGHLHTSHCKLQFLSVSQPPQGAYRRRSLFHIHMAESDL